VTAPTLASHARVVLKARSCATWPSSCPSSSSLLACKSDPGDGHGGSSSTGELLARPTRRSATVDPNYPPCDCDFKCEERGDVQRPDMSSIC
jgi:hypothetical protein